MSEPIPVEFLPVDQLPIGLLESAIKGDKGDDGDDGAAGPGLAAGGTTGQLAAKASNANYDTTWVDPPNGATNLSIVSRGASTFDVASDTGNDATLPAATPSLAGLMTSSDKAPIAAGINETAQRITSDYTLSAGRNALSVSPVEIAAGVTVTIPSGALWMVV